MSEDIQLAKVRAYHGCRTKDATSYHTDGILANDPDRLVQDLKKIVLTEPGFERFRGNIDQLLNVFDARERDTGAVFVCLDDRRLIEDCGHYLLYGSEWMQCVLGFSAHPAWRGWGVPTVIEVEFHLDQVSEASRSELAEKLLLEWTGIKVNRLTETQALDFSFWFHHSIPAKWIVDHYHPASVMCPYNHVAYISPSESCRNCSK